VQISLIFFITLVGLAWLFAFLSMQQNWDNVDQPVIVIAGLFLVIVIGVASLYIIFPGVSINLVPADILKSLRTKELEMSIADADCRGLAKIDNKQNSTDDLSLIRAITLLRAAIRYMQYVVIPDPLTIFLVPIKMATFSGLVISAVAGIASLVYKSVESDVVSHYDNPSFTGGGIL